MKIQLRHIIVQSSKQKYFYANIYINNRKVGTICNDKKMIVDIPPKYYQKIVKIMREKYADYDDSYIVNSIFSELMEAAIERYELKVKCRSNTIFKIKTRKSGKFLMLATPFNRTVKKHLQDIYGDDLIEFINEMIKKPIVKNI